MKNPLFFKLFRSTVFTVFALILVTCSTGPRVNQAAFGSLGRPTDPVPFREDLRTGTLPSGLRYFILENSMPENRAFLSLVVDGGSVVEGESERGLTHFVEHMAFRGTERFPGEEVVNYLRTLGMRFGSDINANVNFDRAMYGIEVPTELNSNGIRVIPERGLAIIDDWSRAITILPEHVESERAVVLDEFRWGLGAMDRLRRQLFPVLYRGSPYADRLAIGTLDVIENVTHEGLRAHYQKWFRADNMAIILIGDFNGELLEASLEEHFRVEKPASPTNRPRFELPSPRRNNIETLVFTDSELTYTEVGMYFKLNPQPQRGDLANFRSDIIHSLISHMVSMRFTDEITKPETPFTATGSSISRIGRESRFYWIGAYSKTGEVENTFTELLRMKESMLRFGFTESELRTASEALLAQYQRIAGEADRQQTRGYHSSLVNFIVNGGYFPSHEWQLYAVQELLGRITVRDVNDVAKSYFTINDVLAYIFAPESELASLPSEARLSQQISTARNLTVQRPVNEVLADSLLPQVPNRGVIASETRDADTNSTIWTLGNGARVILRPTTNMNDQIVLHGSARGGTSSAVGNEIISARFAAEMAQMSGLGTWSLAELTRMNAAKQVSFQSSIFNYQRDIRGTSTSGDLQTLFEMLYLGFTDTRIEANAVQSMIDRYRTTLPTRLDNPQSFFSDEVGRTITSNLPNFRPLVVEDLSSINIDTALNFIQRGLNPADFTFVFTGNVTDDLMRDYVLTYLASIPAKQENFNAWTRPANLRPGRGVTNLYRGVEEQSRVFMGWFIPITYSDNVEATARVLSEYINVRLIQEIRQVYGIYSIGGALAYSPALGELTMQINFTSGPAQVQELINAVQSLVNSTASSLVPSIFNMAVETTNRNFESQMQNNAFIAQNYVDSQVTYNLPMSRIDRRASFNSAVTEANVQQMTTQLLSAGPVTVVLYPESHRP